MADKSLFHLRKHLNALQRSTIRRPYATEPQPTSRPVEEQAAYLHAQDQKHLLETKDQADALITSITKIRNHIASIPTTVQRNPSIPPYTLGHQRQAIRDVPKVADAAIARAQHVKEHLTDLQYEPYPDKKDSGMAAWEKEIAGMSQAEKEDRLQSMQLEEEASLTRLKRDSEGLIRTVKEIEALGRKGGSVDDLAKTANPFQAGAEAKRVPAAAAKAKSEESAKLASAAAAKGRQETSAKPASPPPEVKPPQSLADLQKQLERATYGSSQ